jgi:hypothetical protein
MNWIKIGDKTFYVLECDTQLSIDNHAFMYIKIDIKNHPEYYDEFINLYDLGKIFEIYTIKFKSSHSYIKTIDIEFNRNMSISIRCERIDIHSKSDRRDNLIDEILNNNKTTFIKK